MGSGGGGGSREREIRNRQQATKIEPNAFVAAAATVSTQGKARAHEPTSGSDFISVSVLDVDTLLLSRPLIVGVGERNRIHDEQQQ